ncbi:MAG TPA: hypothetical protein VF522_01200 [Ramlibacter sp.]|uniref:hypothetical protein n=1 Tax=Ramlibacter sp. TaxID=1917967 RepID=UPI002ED443D8
MTEAQAPFAAVCHDAGAANQVIAWIRSAGAGDAVRPVMRGPAERLWRVAFPDRALVDDVESALEEVALLVSGTGWGSELEHEARVLARARGVRSIAVLDHWVNYGQRFERGGTQVLPDEFWVFDEHAYRLARETFPGGAIRRMPNRYLEDQVRAIGPVPAHGAECLYLLEPMRTDWGRGVPGEFQALDYFVEKLPSLKLPPETVIRLRPHPSESASKYADWIRQHPDLRLAVDDAGSLADSLSRSAWVVGCESFGLVVALASNRRVQCALPPWAPPCRLPHEGLVHLSRLAGTP